MDENLKIEFSETNRGKVQVVINRRFKFNFSILKKKIIQKYIDALNTKQKINVNFFFIILNNKEILKYEDLHYHLEKECDVSISLTKYRIKEEIGKSFTSFNIRPKRIFNEISKEVGFLCPEYDTIKSQITRNINKKNTSRRSNI